MESDEGSGNLFDILPGLKAEDSYGARCDMSHRVASVGFLLLATLPHRSLHRRTGRVEAQKKQPSGDREASRGVGATGSERTQILRGTQSN